MTSNRGVLPTFLVLGAPRSATTSLHYYLGQHPQVVMSRTKEPNFFLFDQLGDGRPFVADDRRIVGKSVRSKSGYEELFRGAEGSVRTAVGEASPLYLYTRETPALVTAMVPRARGIAVLRDPVERAWSHFRYVTGTPNDQAESPFLEYVAEERPLPDEPYRSGTHHLRLGRYAAQLARWRDALGVPRLLVLDYRDVVARPGAALERVCSFLEVEPGFRFDTSVRWNPATADAAGMRRFDRLVAPVLPTVKRVLPAAVVAPAARARAQRRARRRSATAPAVPASAYDALRDYYAADIAAVHDEWGLDLSGTTPS